MEPYATIENLQARWRVLSSNERTRAETLLVDASALIASECRAAGITIDLSDDLTATNLCAITCEMVKRSMVADTDQAPLTSSAISAGPYSQTLSFANPTGDIYLTNAERKRLGIKKQAAASISPYIGWGLEEQ